MDEKNKEDFINKSLFILGKNYAYQDSITIDDEDLNKLINDVTSEVPQAYLTLKNYLLSLKFYLKRSASKYVEHLLLKHILHQKSELQNLFPQVSPH